MPASTGVSFVVDSNNDYGDENPSDGLCNTDVGDNCTLRAAIEEINLSASGGTISFAIPGSGSHEIDVGGSPLPPIEKPVVIDGTTEIDFENGPVCSCEPPDPGHLAIYVRGEGGGDGLILDPGSDGSTIRGLAIGGFDSAGLTVESDGNTIVGNYIGTQADGLAIVGNGEGVVLHGEGNRLGGPTAADRNVIAANSGAAVSVSGGADGTVISGNYVGVDRTGLASRPNDDGIVASGVSGLTIGGSTLAAGNVIGASNAAGIDVQGDGGDPLQHDRGRRGRVDRPRGNWYLGPRRERR